MNASEKNALIKQQNKNISAIYKGQITRVLNEIQMNDAQRASVQSLVTQALDSMMPLEKVEETKVEEDNVVCKLLLKGYPQYLFASLEPILKSLIVKNTKTGVTDLERTNKYVMTLMLEKVKKP